MENAQPVPSTSGRTGLGHPLFSYKEPGLGEETSRRLEEGATFLWPVVELWTIQFLSLNPTHLIFKVGVRWPMSPSYRFHL